MRGPAVKMGLYINAITFVKKLLLCSWIFIRFIKYTVMMRRSVSFKGINVMAPWSGVLLLKQDSSYDIW